MAGRFTGKLRSGVLAAGAVALFAVSQAAPAQMFLTQPNFTKGPVQGNDPLVGLPIPGATPAEYRAHLLWNLRAGLNVAALQCQFSRYMRAVDNYNALLAHHSKELAEAYTTLNGYFKRVNGKDGMRRFDDYTTSTYNNFSTLHAQYGFCQTATSIAKEALTRPKGQLHVTAEARMRELRSSLVPVQDRMVIYNPYLIAQPAVPPLSDKCYDRKNQLKKKCAAPGYREG
jgi:hypothetical protein